MRGRLLAAALGMPLEMVRESLIGLAERGLIADATGDEPSAGPRAWTSRGAWRMMDSCRMRRRTSPSTYHQTSEKKTETNHEEAPRNQPVALDAVEEERRHVPLARTQAKSINAHDDQFQDEMSAFAAQVFDAIDRTDGSPLAIAQALHEPTPVVIAALNHLEHTGRVTAKDVGAQRSWAKTRG